MGTAVNSLPKLEKNADTSCESFCGRCVVEDLSCFHYKNDYLCSV